MHELSLSQNILNKVQHFHTTGQWTSVNKIHLKIGALSCIDQAALTFCFAALAKNTIAQYATLDCEIVPAIALCHNCQQQYSTNTLFSFCQYCNSKNTILIAGNEFVLTHIEVN